MALPNDLKTPSLINIAHMSSDRFLYKLPVRMWGDDPGNFTDGYLYPLFNALYLYVTYTKSPAYKVDQAVRIAKRKDDTESWELAEWIGDMYIHMRGHLWEPATLSDIDLLAKDDPKHRYAIISDGQMYYDPVSYSDHITAYDASSKQVEIPSQLVDIIIRSDWDKPHYPYGYYIDDDYGDTYIHTVSGWWQYTDTGLKPVSDSNVPDGLIQAHIEITKQDEDKTPHD